MKQPSDRAIKFASAIIEKFCPEGHDIEELNAVAFEFDAALESRLHPSQGLRIALQAGLDAGITAREIFSTSNASAYSAAFLDRILEAIAPVIAAEKAKLLSAAHEKLKALEQDKARLTLAIEDAEKWGNALNEASWEMVSAYRSVMQETESAKFWNNSKTILRAALLKFFDSIKTDAARPPGPRKEGA